MEDEPRAAGLAALAICESILLSLTERELIDEAEVEAILKDAAAAFPGATGEDSDYEMAARLIKQIISRSHRAPPA
jgi:hypothetical protein